MKEKIYGWYPSIKDVYTDRIGVPSDYHVECLYNFKGTMYHTKPAVPGPDNLVILGHAPESPRHRPSTAIRSPVSRKTHTPQRPKTAPIPHYKPVPKLYIPTPQECWNKRFDETVNGETYGAPTAFENITHAYQLPQGYDSPPSTASTQISWPLPREKQRIPSRRERVQSATTQRSRQTTPKRPVKSAGPVRSQMTPAATPIMIPTDVSTLIAIPSPPPLNDTISSSFHDITEVHLKDNDGKVVPDYEQEKERYGWGVEVHGNPFNYKKLPRRLPYTVKLQIPEVAPEPPRIHMETNETFFQNTIPRRPMAFSIHKDWVSEVLHAKRIELQKREGMKYRYKNFAFVY